MNAMRVLAQSVRSMQRYRLRTFFMMLGSLVGVASLTFAISLGVGVQGEVLRTVRQIMGDASVIVIGGGGRIMGSPRSGVARLTIDDLAAVAKEVPGIVDWDPQAELARASLRSGDASATARVLGQSERWPSVWGRGVAKGVSFDASAVASSARVALIGETVARKLYPSEDPVGAEVQVDGVSLKIIGVLEPFGVDLHGMDRDNEVVVPVSTLMRRLDNRDAVGLGKLIVSDPARTTETVRAVTELLRRRHSLDRDVPDDFTIMSAMQAKDMVSMVRRVLLLYVPLVSGIVLIVGGTVAATLMLGAVNERVGEIGLRRAVGATPADIRRQFLVETSATIVAGGVGGILLGYLGVAVVALHVRFDVVFSWTAVLIGIPASMLIGWLAGVMPARRAASMNPADALR